MNRSFLATKLFRRLYLFVLFAIIPTLSYGEQSSPLAIQGFLDLSHQKVSQPLALDGQWEFYWKKFLSPMEKAVPDSWVDMPKGNWLNLRLGDKNLPAYGFASYRLKIQFSEETELMAIKIPETFSACKLFINGQLVFSSGNIGVDQDHSQGFYQTGTAEFMPQPGLNEVLLLVSNFQERRGGINRSLILGSPKIINDLYIISLSWDLIIFGLLFAMGAYHLALYFIRKRESAALWFGIFCLILSIRTLLYGERFLFLFLPNWNWSFFNVADHLTFYLGIPMFAEYVRLIFSKDTSKVVIRVFQGLGLLFSVFLFLPARIFNFTVMGYELVNALIMPYILFVFLLALYRKRDGSILTIVGVIIFFIFGLNEILYNLGLVQTFNSLSLGLVVFLFTQAIRLAIGFSNAFTESERLETLVYQRNEDLQHKNMTLGHRIEELLNLNRLAHKLTTARDIDTLTQSFGTDLRRLVKADKCLIALVGTGEPVLSVIWPEEEKNWDSGSQPLFNFVVDNRQSVFLSADEKESFYSDFLPLLKTRGATTVLASPLQTYDTFIGLLFLERMAPGPGFTLLDTTLVETAGSLFTGALETLRLLDRERTARQEAEQANQTKSRFLASMSHEIRTPMGAILGFTQLLLGENDLKSDHRDHLGIIQSSGTHLMNIINDILDMSKIEAGKIIVQNQEFSLSRVLEALKGMFFLQFYRKGLNFEVKFLSDLPAMVLGDESKLNQILLNLLSNSLKFTTKGSTTLEVNWKKETSEAVFTVSDTGKGIPKQDQDHVFEAFYQSPGHRSPSEGLGLGLAISRWLTEAMKGTLSFTSTGGGTTFTLQIPLPEARTPQLL